MSNNPCSRHWTFPEIVDCDVCRTAYEDVLRRWYGESAVENFRINSQREIVALAIRSMKK